MDPSPRESIPSHNLAAFHQQVISEVELQNIRRVDISHESPSLLAAMALLESAKQILERRPEIAESFSAHPTTRRAEVDHASDVIIPISSADEENDEKTEPKPEESWESVKNTLMVVASLIATVTFQAALTPLGGVWQDWPQKQTKSFAVIEETISVAPDYKPGEAIGTISYPSCLENFLMIDALGFVSSLCVMGILLFFMMKPPILRGQRSPSARVRNLLKGLLGLLLLEAIIFIFVTFWLGMHCLFPNVNLRIAVPIVALSFGTFVLFLIIYVVKKINAWERAKESERTKG